MKRLLMSLVMLTLGLPGMLVALEADAVKAALLKVRPDLPIETIADSPISGFYQVNLAGGTLLHVTADAKYFVAGDLYSISPDALVNLSEGNRNARRKELIGAVDESEMLIFGPEEPKATVTVFTDVDCTYCRRLHNEVARMNELGIRIRYLAYPRAGIPSESYDKIASAWCSDDPNAALTKAKAGETIPKLECENPIARHLALGNEVGVTGTPALVLESGELVPGYMPADSLAARLGIN